ncbi:glycosyltransferase [Halorarum halobium]|uniref:glycosyltransferase n=1 Tax=Halorarum halobium TaxID=3075121 RepID=UPI0028A6919D|nr:glycosyltransferase [Halobaculum sp. XH14]
MSEKITVRRQTRGTDPLAVSIVIPTYNESETIGSVVKGAIAALSGYSFEVLVVDDSSPDQTAQTVRREFENDFRITVVERSSKQGRASAVVEGIERSEADIVAVLDGDGQHPPDVLPELFTNVNSGTCSVAVASRYRAGSAVQCSLPREAISRASTRLAKMSCEQLRPLSDPLSGLFVADKSCLFDIEISGYGLKILPEVLAQVGSDAVIEVPYRFDRRAAGRSTVSLRTGVAFLHHILRVGRGNFGTVE